MNLFLHGAEDFHIERGDTLRLPAFYSGDSLATFDCVIANPPFSLEKWGDDVWINDPYGRNFAGLPPAKSGDFAWVQHMIKSMARKTGRMAVVLPHGVLFRMSKEGEIRRKLLEMDILEAVIGLGQNIFYGTGLAPCVLVFRDSKPKAHRQKVLFIDASKEFRPAAPRTSCCRNTWTTSIAGTRAIRMWKGSAGWLPSTRFARTIST